MGTGRQGGGGRCGGSCCGWMSRGRSGAGCCAACGAQAVAGPGAPEALPARLVLTDGTAQHVARPDGQHPLHIVGCRHAIRRQLGVAAFAPAARRRRGECRASQPAREVGASSIQPLVKLPQHRATTGGHRSAVGLRPT